MKKILQVAGREVQRFRARFSGSSRPVILLLVAVALLVSYLVAQQGLVLGRGIYTIGVSPDGPPISDARFNVLVLGRSEGIRMLDNGSIDLYMDGDTALARNDMRSQYAEGALQQYLQKAETSRLIAQYDINQSFPLRVEVDRLPQASALPAINVNTPVGTPSVSGSPARPSPDATAVPSLQPVSSETDTSQAVEAQIKEAEGESGTQFKAEFVSDKEILVPSLMSPPLPLSQVVLAFLYVVPMLFMGVFFNSSFMEEKTNRKLIILMSTPITPFDVIAGKMLPYVSFSLAVVVAVTLLLGGNVLLSLAIFLPVVLFVFSIYLIVSLVYRTFKDQTFFSMAAITFVTGYLVLPALFTGINNISLISPLTLAVQMYRGESFGLADYAISTAPMYLVFALSMFVGVRIFNEEYLMSFGPLYRKAADAVYLAIDKGHPYVSIALLGLFLVPAVFMVEMIISILSLLVPVSLPTMAFLAILLSLCVIVEEVAKSAGIATLLENKDVTSARAVLLLSFASALGFFIGEKLLLYLSLGVVSNVMLIQALGSANMLVIPLIAHFIFTSVVCLATQRLGTRYYPLAIFAGCLLHFAYDFYILAGQAGAM